MRRDLIAARLEAALRESFEAPQLRLVALDGDRPPADEAREPWIPVKYGPASADDWFGVTPARARFERAPGRAPEALDLVVKVAPREGLARTLVPWIVARYGIALDRPYPAYRSAAALDRTAGREPRLYDLARGVPALARVLPRCYGAAVDETGGQAVFLEFVADARRLDASGARADWPPQAIDAAIRALAGWQAAFWGADAADLAWAAPRPTTADMIADADLWRALLDDGRKRRPDIVTDEVWRERRALIDDLAAWHPTKDAMPTTLAHNDFNQRNVGFRPEVVVFDWELAQANGPHRDLVELLTFVLPETFDRAQVDRHVETHRSALLAAGVSSGLDRDGWFAGFRCELKVEAIDRVGLQLLFAAAYPLAYLTRINANVGRLLALYR